MIVVSDASPLIGLSAVGHLDLLARLYREVLVPEAVHREVTGGIPEAPGAAAVRAAEWVRVHPVRDSVLVAALALELDPDEAEAMALAVETESDLLLMDERRGRAAAVQLGARVVGVLGVLIEAKHQGLLRAVRPVLEALRTGAGFHLCPALYARVLQVAGE